MKEDENAKLLKRAAACLKAARTLLGDDASDDLVEAQALVLMSTGESPSPFVRTVCDRAEAAEAVAKINQIIGSIAIPLLAAIQRLDGVVGRSQNGPPDGEADGTLSGKQWTMLRDFAKQARASLGVLPQVDVF